jgi:general secretion pathway protein F
VAAQSVDRFLLAAPVVGRFFRAEAENEFYWFMGTLLTAGIPVREALSFAVRRGSNHAFRKELKIVEEAVLQGEPLGDALQGRRLLTEAASAMIRTAEETGNLAEVFLTLAAEARGKRSLVGQGLSGAIWALYFAMAAIYVFLAVLGFYGGMADRLKF